MKLDEEMIDGDLRETIESLIKKRNEYRLKNDWINADKIRNKLMKMNVVIQDDRNSTKWRFKK